jgi:hypothetical protein
MLGWEFFVTRQVATSAVSDAAKEKSVASWRAGLGGTEWLDNLVSNGVAADLGGNGYPNLYKIPASALVAILGQGLPKHDGPLVIGDDYVTPGGWTGGAIIDAAVLQSIDANEDLLVEAWDQS